MTQPPASPKLYHITHIDNVAAIVADGCLVSDAMVMKRGGPPRAIGMSAIKRRRIEELQVGCHPHTKVGDYVPFYFCPRSVMLFVIHCANHPDLTYRGGQVPIVHLEVDLREVVRWTEGKEQPWAFSLANAGARYAEFSANMTELNRLNWQAIAATDFRAADVKEAKQCEFLVHDRLPLHLVERIGVCTPAVRESVTAAFTGTSYSPRIEVRREWYF